MSANGYANNEGKIEIIISSWDRSKILKTCVVECNPGEAIEIETNLLETKQEDNVK